MSGVGSWELQKAIVTTLRTSVSIVALVSGVFDEVPEGTAFPYIVVGEGEEEDDQTFGADGHAVRPNIEIWTVDGADSPDSAGASGYKQGMAIAALVRDAMLADGALSVTGYTATVLRMDELERRRFPDPPPTQRAVVPKFVILLEAA